MLYSTKSNRLCRLKAVMLSFLAMLCVLSVQAQSRIYVSPQGGGDGSSWESTLTLSDALSQAKAGDEIWLRGYEQITSTKQQLYVAPKDGFVLPSGVKLYGGFAGTETNISQRKNQGKPYQMTYRSVLSGDINGDDKIDPVNTIFPENTTRSDNAKHVLVVNAYRNSSDNVNDNSNPTVVDGLTIIGGHGATTSDFGGGIYVKGDANNSVAYSIARCYLLNNYAYKGGAIYVDGSVQKVATQSLINQCVVYNNVAGTVIGKENLGGGIYMAGAGNIVNTSVFNNENGGVVLSSKAYLVNSTVNRNTGGGVDMVDANNSDTHVYNSVVWGNSNVTADSNKQPQFDHSAYPGASADNNNVNLSANNRGDANSPMFDAPSLKTSFDQDYNWRRSAYPTWSWKLVEGSCLIDKGSNDVYNSYSNNYGQDLGGETRIVGTAVDISSYEFQAIPAARIRYVKEDGSDSNNGTSWAQAYASVQKAIDDLAAQPGVPGEVWIAGGRYEPTALINGDGTPASFRMHDGISVYGGFVGTESSKSERAKGDMPWQFENETILSGSTFNGENKWNSTDNKWSLTSASTHVVWFAPLPGAESFENITVLDGVTIQGGQAKTSEASNYEGNKGAGVYMSGGNVYLTNSIVKSNVAPSDGGGIYLKGGRVQGCLVYNNSSESRGGGIYVDNAGLVLRSMVTNNSSLTGGGVYLDNNGVQADGQEHPEYLILSTSVVSNNTSVNNGAVYCNNGGVILQSTITNNYTPTATDAAAENASHTGGLYINTYAQVFNSVLWNNRIKDQNVQLYAQNASADKVSFYYSALSGMNNIIWNNTLQKELISLSDENSSTEVSPDFSAGYPASVGVDPSLLDVTYFWEPISGSNLRAQGMSLGQLPSSVLLAPELDLAGKSFAQKPEVGAFSIQATNITPEETDNSIVVYVDVDKMDPENDGSSWTKPYRSLNEAIAYMAGLSKDKVGNKTLEIRVAEGDIWPRYAYVNQDAKSATIEVPAMKSGSTLYIKGGYSADGSTRAPLTYRSQINGNHEGKVQSEGLYHCITVEQGANVEFDGFHIINGYAAGTANLKYGAGMLVRDGATVTVKNSIFENNTAFEGAAIDARAASLTLTNCVVNNNTNETNTASVINCPNSNLTLNHVTVVNNIGAAPADMGSSSFAAGNTSGDTHTIDMTTANFVNPTKNPGAILGFDTYLGGYSSFMPTNQCVVVNQASSVSGLSEDITGGARSRGGAPDLGAYEAELPVDGTVIYVRQGGTGDGSTWEKAMGNIQEAINKATNGVKEIWVAAGTYNERITLKNGVDLLGGFADVGNPDNKLDDTNRNISNTKDGFMTIIDGQSGDRVVTQSGNFNTLTTIEGFIIQNGSTSGSEGGAGVLLKNNGKIKNCLIQKNVYNMTSWNRSQEYGGGGVRIEGSGIIESSIVRNNTVSSDGQHSYVCGGGLYLKADNNNTPELINCVVAENEAINKGYGGLFGSERTDYTLGGAAYLTGNGARIYNCTFAYNKADARFSSGSKAPAAGGVWDAGFLYNENGNDETNNKTGSSFYNCIFWGNYGKGGSEESTYQVGAQNFKDGHGFNPKVYNCYISATTESQVKIDDVSIWDDSEQCFHDFDRDYSGDYDGEEFSNACRDVAPFDNATFMLNNSGTGLNCINKGNNDYVTDIDLDAAGATRIQYCTVDKGAYESTDAITIESDGNGVYYVTQNGAGSSNGSSVTNASCAMELQRVLDAAGERAKTKGTATVKIAGYEGEYGKIFVYHANTLSDTEDPQSYTFKIPYGVIVEGGYNGLKTDSWEDADRNPKKYRTVLSAICNSSSLEQEVNGYHTVTFGAKPTGWTGADNAQTIIDGLYLIDGKATSMAGEGNPNTRGGGAVVPAWAHVRNCVVAQCEAVQGGALYLEPGATVSGTLIMANTAEEGAGIYAANQNAGEGLRAHIISSTITDNTATETGGGIYMEDYAVLATNSVIWNNSAPSDKNISGVVGTPFADEKFGEVVNSAITTFYPFNHCYVETYELPSNYENTSMKADESLYFATDRTLKAYSELIKHGTINQAKLVEVFGVSATDMQNISRIQDGSERIDVGAYAFEGGLIPVPKTSSDPVVKKIFVSQGSNVEVSGNMDDYIGRSFYTSLSWLDDALEYIKKVRAVSGLEGTEFEIYVAGGTYKPSNGRGATTTIDQRQNSYVLPAGVKIYGGFSGTEDYGYGVSSLPLSDDGTIGLDNISDDSSPLLAKRSYSDLNGNGIEEPWELENQTILSGDINVSPSVKNAYHVVYSSGSGSVLLDGVTIKDGETSNEMSADKNENEVGRGGALYTNGVDYTLKGCRVMNSKAVCGGAIYARDADLTIIGSVIGGNGTVEDAKTSNGEEIRGGAVYLSGDTKPVALNSINTLWANNETTGKGGAIATSDANATVSLMNNTIVRNKADEASAVYAAAGDITNTVMWGGEGTGVVSTGLTVKNSASDVELSGNNNVKLNTSNMAIDGPRFVQPSTAVGMAANDVASKWNPASISVLTDAGDGQLDYGEENMSEATGAYIAWARAKMADDPTFYMGDNTVYKRYMGPKSALTQTQEPKKIDIGLYEYQYKSDFLKMDTIYVDTQERGDGSGDSWDNATSDIRGAIVALSDPEGGSTTDKTIYIRGGEYPQSQLYVGDIAYQAVLNDNNSLLTSLTIKGSYAENGQQDFSQPTVLLPSTGKPVQTMFFANTNGKKLTLEGITFQNAGTNGFHGNNGNSGTLNLKNVAFRHNGTGANIEGSGATLIANALFADGTTGLSTTSGNNVTVVNATFANNTSEAVSGTPAVYNSVAWKSGSGLAGDAGSYYNVNLGDATNDDLLNGPNFVDPANGNYMLRPSLKLLNKASKDKYNELLGADAAETDKDLGNNARLTGDGLDVGAYEYNAALQQIVYVKNNVAQTDGSGTSWQNPITDLQSAIDLASVYANNNSGQNGYVFVHRNVSGSGIRVNMPNVKVYGGMNDEAGTDAQSLINARSSVLADNMSTISGLTVSGQESVVDGFKVQGSLDAVKVTDGVLSTSVIENATVGADGIVYNSFVSGDLNGAGKAVNVTSPNAISVQDQENVVAPAPENGYVSDDIWKYQLKENDLGINNRNAVNVSPYMEMVGHNRDLSGMPRVRDGVDAGCFESWTMTANTINKEFTADAMPTSKHVVYVDKGVEISLAPNLYPDGTNFNLGFLLLKHGAGFRSNGNAVSLTNLAVERDLDEADNRWDMAYMPFEVTRTTVDGNDGLSGVSVKTYDGARRAEYDYQFSATDGAWTEVADELGGKGLLLQSADDKDHTVRMYGSQYVEYATQSASRVSLNKYNNMEPWSSASDNTSKRFTHLENMSWNMFGSPFLCAMNYGDMEYGRVIYKKSGNTFASENTAEATGSVPAGSAVLTQSATLQDQETFTVTKRTDEVQDGTTRGTRLMVALAPQGQSEQDALALTAVPTEEASSEFNMAADGVKMMTVGRAAQIYMERAGQQYSLLSALDLNGKVDVSVYAPEAGTYSIFIPEDSPVDEYETVVLKDKVTGRAVDLLEGAYSFPMSEPGTLSSRFTLSFNRELSEDGLNRITFRALGNGQVRVSGLESGDRITAYQENGMMVYRQSAASAAEQTISLPGKISLIQVQSADGRETIKKLVIR